MVYNGALSFGFTSFAYNLELHPWNFNLGVCLDQKEVPMKKLFALGVAALMMLAIVFLFAGCGGSGGSSNSDNGPSFTYTPIVGVPQAVNDLGQLIDQKQRNVVTPGGSEWAPGYSSYDQSVFESSSSNLTNIVSAVKADPKFAAGVAAIRNLPVETQTIVFAAYSRPLYPTWAMNGVISDAGTTDAGYTVEGEIATALTNAVKSAL